MREKQNKKDFFEAVYKQCLAAVSPKNPLVKELRAIDKLLDEMPEILDYVSEDIKEKDTKMGRRGKMSVEQVLRSAILMNLRGLSYRDLAQEIDTNVVYRQFTRFHIDEIPHFTTFNDLIKKIRPETLEKINKGLLGLGIKKKVEDGKRIRADTTVSRTDMAYPIDARLLNDSIRVLSRLLERLREESSINFVYHNNTKRSKKRAYEIAMAKGKTAEKKIKESYEVLFKVHKKVRGYVSNALMAIKQASRESFEFGVQSLKEEIERFLILSEQVYSQAYRRIKKGEQVPANEKLVSIFETHTDIICRGKKGSPVEFGHKIQFATGQSGLITWYKVLEGNPSDGEDFVTALDHHEEVFGAVPKAMTMDRRYFSKANEEIGKERGVEKLATPKPGYLNKERKRLQKTPWFKRLIKWRCGIEGQLSTMLRTGMKRCLWKGWKSFKSFIGLKVFTSNLRVLAAHLC